MAREHITTLYQYDELCPEAQETARNWYRECLDYDWWTDVYDDIAHTADIIGIRIDTRTVRLMGGGTRQHPDFCFDLDRGNYFSFGGFYSYDKGWKEKAKAEYGKDIFTRDKAGQRLTAFLQDWDYTQRQIQAPAFWGLRCTISTVSSGILWLDCKHLTTTDYENDATPSQEQDLIDLIEKFQEYALDSLKAEWDWLNSEESVTDIIRANGYEFTVEGNRA